MSETTEREPVTVTDYHHQQVGRAVIDALRDADPELWFDVGVAVATDKRTQEAILDARESSGWLSSNERSALLNDIDEILEALDLGTHARPYSVHQLIQGEILPEIRRLKDVTTPPQGEEESDDR